MTTSDARFTLQRETTSADAFCSIARRYLDDLVKLHDETARGDFDALHHMRVANMHLRTTLSFFSPMISDREQRRLTKELKWLNRRLGKARDLDVTMVRLTECGDRFSVADLCGQSLDRKWIKQHLRLAETLRSERYQRLIKDFACWIRNGPWSQKDDSRSIKRRATPVSIYSARTLAQWHENLLQDCPRLDTMSAAKRHHLRIRTKKLRYAMEIFAEKVPSVATANRKKAVKYLRLVQDSLGELNDAENAELLITKLKGSTRKTAERNRHRERRLERKASSAFQKLAGIQLFNVRMS